MSNLVRIPEDRFSHDAAQLLRDMLAPISQCLSHFCAKYEPRSEKTGLRGFRPGPTQTGLYSHRRWLEA